MEVGKAGKEEGKSAVMATVTFLIKKDKNQTNKNLGHASL